MRPLASQRRVKPLMASGEEPFVTGRTCLTRDLKRKRFFSTKADAKHYARKNQKPYECPSCGMFHLTTKR